MAIHNSINDESRVLNTSNITVPSVATMVQHLLDSDPHPQYLAASDLVSSVKLNVNVGDLADVNFGLSVPEDSLMVYRGGSWSSVTVSTLIGTSSSTSAVRDMVVNNANVTSSAFAKAVSLKEEAVVLNQSDISTAASAAVSGHIVAVYNHEGKQQYPDIVYANGISTITKNFGSIISQTWSVVHTEAILVSVSSGVLSI